MVNQQPKYAFFGGKIVPIEEAKVSVMTHAFNYGTGVFAGMRAYWNDDEQQLFIFRAHDHFERFRQSAGLMRIDVPYSEARTDRHPDRTAAHRGLSREPATSARWRTNRPR